MDLGLVRFDLLALLLFLLHLLRLECTLLVDLLLRLDLMHLIGFLAQLVQIQPPYGLLLPLGLFQRHLLLLFDLLCLILSLIVVRP